MHLVYAYIVINCLTFILYGIDKFRAHKHGERFSERMLLSIACSGGALGAYIAMHMFRHKTMHKRFCIMVPIALAIHYIAFIVYFMIN